LSGFAKADFDFAVQNAKQSARDVAKAKAKQAAAMRAAAGDDDAENENEAENPWDENVESLFNEIDADGSGFLDRDEIMQLTINLGKQFSEAQLDEAMGRKGAHFASFYLLLTKILLDPHPSFSSSHQRTLFISHALVSIYVSLT
jgi:hypothetical protein